jgi:hypothetical protein
MTIKLAPSRPWYVVFLAVVTPIYLAFELSFNARLLDITGGMPSYRAIQAIEWWGRLISGIALTLLVWGFVLPALDRRIPSKLAILILMAGIGAISIALTFHFESMLVSGPSNASSPARLQKAYLMEEVDAAIADGNLHLASFPTSRSEMQSPAGKAFLALFPLLASQISDLNQKARAAMEQAVKLIVEKKIGNPDTIYNNTLHNDDSHIKSIYNYYIASERQYVTAVNKTAEEETSAWSHYTSNLAQRELQPYHIPLYDWNQIRNSVIYDQHIPVSSRWNPNDRVGFDRAVAHKIMTAAKTRFRTAIHNSLGVSLALDLSWPQFLAQRAIHEEWLVPLQKAHAYREWITPETDYQEWHQRYYLALVNKKTNRMEKHLVAPASDFARGGPYWQAGRHAMEALLAPAWALVFSITGALYHLFKSGKYLGWVALPAWRRVTIPLVALGAILAGLAPLELPNAVTQSKAVHELTQGAERAGEAGGVDARLSRWVMQAQPYFYPENNAIREDVFQGFGFRAIPGFDARRTDQGSKMASRD